MAFDINGKLHKKYETEVKGASFKVREFVIHTEHEQYPQFLKFQLTQDRCELVDGYSEGEIIKVHFDLRGREWQDKYFTNLNAWRIEKGDESDNSSVSSTNANKANAPAPSINDMPNDVEDEMDNVPF